MAADFPLDRFERAGTSSGTITSLQAAWLLLSSDAQDEWALYIESISDQEVAAITDFPDTGGALPASAPPGGQLIVVQGGPPGPPGITANWRALWLIGTTYTAGPPPDGVLGSNGHWYVSLTNGNIGHDPTTDGGVHWADALPASVISAPSLPSAAGKMPQSINDTTNEVAWGDPVSSVNEQTGVINLGGSPQFLSTSGIINAGIVPVATRTEQSQAASPLSDGVNTFGHTVARHQFVTVGSVLYLIYTNTPLFGTGSAANTYTVKATVETPTGAFLPVMFAGASSATVAPGAQLVSDPIELGYKPGDVVWSHNHVSVPTVGQKWPTTLAANGVGESVLLATSDLSANLTISRTELITETTAFAFAPMMLAGPRALPSRPYVIGLGDSIMYGVSESGVGVDAASNIYEGGFFHRSVDGQLPCADLGVYGEELSTVAPTTLHGSPQSAFAHRQIFARAADYAVDEYGSNDLFAGASAATVEQNIIFMATWLASNGTRVYRTTLLPRPVSSTDDWATVANQTLPSWDAVRVAVNTWIRGGCPIDPTSHLPVAVGTGGALLAGQATHPIVGMFDIAATVESTTPGKWITNGTAEAFTIDGTHPSPLGHQTIATAIDSRQFTGNGETSPARYSVSNPIAPTAISGLDFLLNPETLTPATGALTSWPDDSGNNFNGAVNHTAPIVRRSVFDANGNVLLNGLPVLRFPGGSSTNIELGNNPSTPYEVFLVFRSLGIGSNQAILTGGAGPTLLKLGSGGLLNWYSGGSVGIDWANFHIYSAIFGTGSDEIRIDGQLAGTGSHASHAIGPCGLGGDYGSGAEALDGDFVFAAAYTAVLTMAQRLGLLKWISNKTGIALA